MFTLLGAFLIALVGPCSVVNNYTKIKKYIELDTWHQISH